MYITISGGNTMLEKIKAFRWGYILLFLALAAVGACFIAFYETLPTLALVIGIILIVYGIFSAVIAISDKKRGGKYAARIIISVICIICGTVTAVLRESSVNILSSLIGLFLVIDGSFKINTAAMSKRYKLLSWWLMVIPAALVILGGFLSLKFNDLFTWLDGEDKLMALSYTIGVTMIIDALANFLSAFYVGGFERKLVREIRHEIDLENEKKALEAAEADATNEPTESEPTAPEAPVETTDTEATPTDEASEATPTDEVSEATPTDEVSEATPTDEVSEATPADNEAVEQTTAEEAQESDTPDEKNADETNADEAHLEPTNGKKKKKKKKRNKGDR